MLARIYYRAVATDAVGVKQLVVLTLPSRPICVPKGRHIVKGESSGKSVQGERRLPFKANDATYEVGHVRADWLGLELYETRQFIVLVELSSVGRNESPKTKKFFIGNSVL